MDELAILDQTVLAELRPPIMEDDLLRELIAMFLADAPVRLAALQTAAMGADLRAVAAVAHSLKSAAGNLGAQRVVELCFRLEAAARLDDLILARKLLDTLEVELARAYPALEAEVDAPLTQ